MTTTVTTQNYIQHAMRTNSDTVGTYNVHPDLIHGALGLADEFVELRQALDKCDRVNALEELSDLCWFLSLIANQYEDSDPFDIWFFHTDTPMADIEYFVGKIVSHVKRAYAYGKPIETNDMLDCLDALAESISGMAEKLGSSLKDVLALNIEKLAKRYPEKFTPEQANNRDYAGERELLEKHA